MKYNFTTYWNPVFVETGSADGTGILAALRNGFPMVYSIELSVEYFNRCKLRFYNRKRRVRLFQGSSQEMLPIVLSKINEKCTFWLDAHYCGGSSGGQGGPVPIMDELKAIKNHHIKDHTILIDDIRLLREENGEWDYINFTLKDVEDMIYSINPKYQIIYIFGIVEGDILVAKVMPDGQKLKPPPKKKPKRTPVQVGSVKIGELKSTPPVLGRKKDSVKLFSNKKNLKLGISEIRKTNNKPPVLLIDNEMEEEIIPMVKPFEGFPSFDSLIQTSYNFQASVYNTDVKWATLKKMYEKNFINGEYNTKIIPKKIHQIWLGSTIPEKYKEWTDSWKKFNPDWDYYLWTEDNINQIKLTDVDLYNTIINFGPKSDYLRYHILYQFGGFYLDTDFECFKSFEDLRYLSFVTGVGYPANVELYVGLIGCTPKHPLMKYVLQQLNHTTQKQIRKDVLGSTSSHFFTRAFFDKVTAWQPGIVALPPDFFYPYPNKKGYQKEDGRDYVKPISYANHYWEVSWNTVNNKTDWVQGDKFVRIADMVYAPHNKVRDDYAKYTNTFNPANLKSINYVYTNVMYLSRFLRILSNLPQKFVVMAHNGDQHIEKGVIGTYNNHKKVAEEPYTLSDNVIKLFTTNVDVVDPRIDSLPLGLENSMWGEEKKESLLRTYLSKHKKKHLVYMNHALNTNYDERIIPYNLFREEKWMTAEDSQGNRMGFNNYYYQISTHKFVMNPWGNCFDNHRMWEAWYLNSIPVMRRCVFTSFYEDMPLCLIDDWKEVTEEFLNKEYERISSMDWNRDKLIFAYWRNKVKSTR